MQGTRACASERDVGDVITKKQCCVKEILSAGPLLQGSGLKPRTGGVEEEEEGFERKHFVEGSFTEFLLSPRL